MLRALTISLFAVFGALPAAAQDYYSTTAAARHGNGYAPASIVAGCARLARPGGMVFVSTINRNVKAYALAVVAAEYVLGLLPRGTHDYAKFLSPAEVASFARHAGLLPAAITGMTYNPLTKAFRLVADTGVNYMMAFRA